MTYTEQLPNRLTKTEVIVEAIRATSPYALADLCVSAFDNQEAIDFFQNLLDNYVEALEDANTGELPDEVRLNEIASGAASIWNNERMLQLVGTKSYYNTSELATGNEDTITLAGYVLYELAGLALSELHEIALEAASDYDADLNFGMAAS